MFTSFAYSEKGVFKDFYQLKKEKRKIYSKNNLAQKLNMQMEIRSMNGGEGPDSYVQNSSYQRGVLEIAKQKIKEEIAKNLEIKQVPNFLSMVDFGCATGHNSFPAVEMITEALLEKFQKEKAKPKIIVFFNDLHSNDFNTLFSSLPPERNYNAVGLPGDFHRRLFPHSSLHFAYSSWSLQWLNQVPKEVNDPTSPAWNKGSIIWTRDRREVHKAYLNQFAKDIESFLEARALELVGGGMMSFLIPAVPASWDASTEYTIPCDINLIGSCLVDMAKQGRICEAQIDSFNVPYYFPTYGELKKILMGPKCRNSYTVVTIETLSNHGGKQTLPTVDARTMFYRAVHERMLTDHFGAEVMDELFHHYKKKLSASPVFLNPKNDKSTVILVILKRKIIRV